MTYYYHRMVSEGRFQVMLHRPGEADSVVLDFISDGAIASAIATQRNLTL